MQTQKRDLALRRLRRITVLSGVAAGTLAAAFAGLAARAVPGKHAVTATVRRPLRAQTRTAIPPPLVPIQAASASSAAAPAAPSAPPAATSAQPVVVSGGS